MKEEDGFYAEYTRRREEEQRRLFEAMTPEQRSDYNEYFRNYGKRPRGGRR